MFVMSSVTVGASFPQPQYQPFHLRRQVRGIPTGRPTSDGSSQQKPASDTDAAGHRQPTSDVKRDLSTDPSHVRHLNKVDRGFESGSILSVESNQNVESKKKNVESKIAFGQLILRKIIKLLPSVVSFKAKMHQNPKFAWGFALDPAGGACSAPPDLLAGFKVAYF